MRTSRLELGRALLQVAAVLSLVAGIGGCTDSRRHSAAQPTTMVVAVDGSDTGTGTSADPLGTITEALQRVKPGQEIWIRGGRYVENIRNPTLAEATSEAPIVLRSFPGEEVEISGLFWLAEPSHWQVSGIRFSWDDRNAGTEHMVKMTGGSDWSFTGNELAGAKSFAALLVAGDARSWRVSDNYIHDTVATNGLNQDHLIYVNATGTNGLVENNLLVNSPNGRAIKVGPPDPSGDPISSLVIRHNTMVNNLGPSNVQVAFDTSNIVIEGNIMQRSANGRPAVTAFDLRGEGIVVINNLFWLTDGVADENAAISTISNVSFDPQLTGLGTSQVLPSNPAAADFGYRPPSGRAE